MEPAEGAMADAVELKIAEDFSFTAVLEPDVEYTASLQGVNDYEIISGKTVNDQSESYRGYYCSGKGSLCGKW